MLEESTQSRIGAFHYRIITQCKTRTSSVYSSHCEALISSHRKLSGVLKHFSLLNSNKKFTLPNKSLQPDPFV